MARLTARDLRFLQMVYDAPEGSRIEAVFNDVVPGWAEEVESRLLFLGLMTKSKLGAFALTALGLTELPRSY